MRYSSTIRLLAAGTTLIALGTPALALDGNDLVKKLNSALYMQQGEGIVPGSVEVNGSNVTLRNSRFEAGASQGGLPLGTIEMEGVEEDAGGYTIETVTFENVDLRQDKTEISASDIVMSGVTVPANTTGNSLDSVLLYDEATTGPMAIKVDGKSVASIGSSKLTTDVSDDDKKISFDLQVADIKADLATIDDPATKQTISDLGITSLDGKVSMTGSWDLEPGTLAIEEYAFDFANIGRLDMAFSLSGYTLDFVRSANETARAMEANPNKEQAEQAANLAMLGLMQRLTFNSAMISFADDGITEKALDVVGKQQGTSGDQLAQMIKAMTPIVLAQYNIPELQNALSQAVNTYLDNPGSLTITAQPPSPVPFPMILGAGMGAPNTLPQVLGVTVKAND
ncbi:hypothetical protein [Aliirhizobium cellulosilyticum]|uniref:Transmembrane protein n=1 Tax=Aliirhizobium cellulosilyticum TaxID=393664 RepID=A0A7W6THJ2_9HYPH|nr:hypothetical protein [Rhizobium cellulosilyticum]MBB4350417.1 hypothetical protein [Rhizobium cellulosilyticum]MBB4413551.1 hypothetical protein [Rhizobium cellulosilyticum]MBB4448184.1 hypothetical protein [Rhizobium cellulosilyticum]